jgi:threonine aldolase
MDTRRSFTSDNSAGIHPEILRAITAASTGHVTAYGDDPYSERVVSKFREQLGEGTEAFLVFNGTAANVLALQALARPHHAIFCAHDAHIQLSECGAPERFTGAKLLPIHCPAGKLTPALVRERLEGVGDQHHVQPRVISIA